MEYDNVLKELYGLESPKIKLGLKNIKELLKKLDNPEKNLKCIHVAGTNGKGSVCAMVSSVLQDAGYKVGLYTSPHLKRFNERIRINNDEITDKEIVDYYLRVKRYIKNQSFFEITTAMMFLYFYENDVDFAVLETGLGGRLDATNTITPLISIITNIGLEHTIILGKTLQKIAYEKSGIIKNNVPIVTGAEGVALETIQKIADKRKASLTIIKKDIAENKKIKLGLKGSFQLNNAAIAAKALGILNKNNDIKINENNIRNGLRNAKWPGRFEFLEKTLLIDCAHNPDGFKILFDELKNISYYKLILVLGFSNDKDIKEISKIVNQNKKINKIILAKAENEKAINPMMIKKYFNGAMIIKNPKKALGYAKKIKNNNDLVLVAGSIYMVGEVL